MVCGYNRLVCHCVDNSGEIPGDLSSGTHRIAGWFSNLVSELRSYLPDGKEDSKKDGRSSENL